jgi:hypothetical protein
MFLSITVALLDPTMSRFETLVHSVPFPQKKEATVPSTTPPPKLPPAGWYPDPEGSTLRWWDGERWTDHRQPTEPSAPVGSPVGFSAVQTVERTDVRAGDPTTVKSWQLLLGGLVVLFVCVGAVALLLGGSNSGSTADDAAATTQKPAATLVPTNTTPPSETLNGTDSVKVEFALEEIHETCHALQEAEIAEATGNQKKLMDAIGASVNSGLVPGDVASLSAIYRQHPNAEFQGRALQEILEGTAEELQVAECNPTGAERLALALAERG